MRAKLVLDLSVCGPLVLLLRCVMTMMMELTVSIEFGGSIPISSSHRDVLTTHIHVPVSGHTISVASIADSTTQKLHFHPHLLHPWNLKPHLL